ncbi:PAS domain S-box protein [Parendozoicomonas sp. Alg238-R29]|uniref:PAS domain S-box protein n=1 Tax=Parendozoicomonas sp. Alg238-R29 TaxID=2993446 RepID=UPI00248F3758|nr:PAS domain S-box protein [Parendozoicomonas sp. Alg238-R29]
MTFSIRQKIIFFTVIPVTLIYNIIFIFSLNQNVASETRYVENQLVESVATTAERLNIAFRDAAILSDMTVALLSASPEGDWYNNIVPVHKILDRNDNSAQIAVLRKRDGFGYKPNHLPGIYPPSETNWLDIWFDDGESMGWSAVLDTTDVANAAGFTYGRLFTLKTQTGQEIEGAIVVFLPATIMGNDWQLLNSAESRQGLFNSDGYLLAFSDNTLISSEKARSGEYRNKIRQGLEQQAASESKVISILLGGEERLLYRHTIPSTGWHLVGTVYTSEFMGVVRSAIWFQAVLMVVSLGVIFLSAWFIAGRIVRPLRMLDKAISKVSSGQLDTVIDIPGDDECSRLARRFTTMTRQLQLRERLEHEARTTAFDHIVQGITGDFFYLRHDLEGNVTFVSPSIEKILGIHVDDFYGHFTKFYTSSPQNLAGESSTVKVLSGDPLSIYEVEMHDGHGNVHHMEIVKVPAYDYEGKVCGSEAMGRDVTKRVSDASRFRGLLESAPDAMVITDTDGLITMVNVRTEVLLGFQRSSLIGRPVSSLFPVKEAKRFPLLKASPEERKKLRIRSGLELKARKRTGQTIPVEITLNPIETSSGTQLSIFMRDVSDRHAAEQALRASEERYRRMIEALQQEYIFYTQRTDGSFMYITDSVEKILGYTPSEFMANANSYLASDKDRALVARVHNQICQGMTHPGYELEIIRADGTLGVIEVVDTPGFNSSGKVTVIEGLVRDRTHERAVAVSLAEAKDAAEAASQAKSMFLSNMSHELRTPLNGVLGYVQLLLSGSDISKQQYDQLLSIEACGQHLLTLINDILDLTKIDAGELELNFAPVNVVTLVESVEQILYQRAESCGLQFDLVVQDDVPASVVGDETKLRQILINLVGNAVKYTDRGRVSLNVYVNDNNLVFAVEDTGIGIPEDYLESIFDPFRQGEGGHRVGGTGLGLSISRRLAAAMKGHLEVESIEGQGSLFTFSMPFEVVEGSQSGLNQLSINARNCRLQQGQDVHVLVVDDTETNREILKHMLLQCGFQVTTANDGREAVRLTQAHSLDLILMDLRMPEVSGFRTARMIISRLKKHCPPIIAISAGVYPSLPEVITRWGFSDFVGKPFRSQDLFRAIRRHLSLRWEEVSVQEANPEEKLSGLTVEQAVNLHAALTNALELGDIDAIRDVAQGVVGDKGAPETLWAERILECCDALAMEELERVVRELAQAS